jgi:hypothetical protein
MSSYIYKNLYNYYNIQLRETLYKFIDFLKINKDILENQNINNLTLDITNKHFIEFNFFLKYLKLNNYENESDDYLTLDFLEIFEESYLYAIEFFKLGENQLAQEKLDIAYSYLIFNPSDF